MLNVIFIPEYSIASDKNEDYVNLLLTGDATDLRYVARQMYNEGMYNQQLLDVLAEKALQILQFDIGGSSTDALAWVCKVLGESRMPRYRDTINRIMSEVGGFKIKRHGLLALSKLPNDDVVQYHQGGIKIEKVKNHLLTKNTQYNNKKDDLSPSNGRLVSGSSNFSRTDRKYGGASKRIYKTKRRTQAFKPIRLIRLGMSLQEVLVIAGIPTLVSNHLLGERQNELKNQDFTYKGQGEVILSPASQNVKNIKVLKLVILLSE